MPVVLQRKFNLLREESEGYAKMITLLSRSGPSGLSEATADATVRAALAHASFAIGVYFRLSLGETSAMPRSWLPQPSQCARAASEDVLRGAPSSSRRRQP